MHSKQVAAAKKRDAFKLGDWETRSGDEASRSKGMSSETTACGAEPMELMDEELP